MVGERKERKGGFGKKGGGERDEEVNYNLLREIEKLKEKNRKEFEEREKEDQMST